MDICKCEHTKLAAVFAAGAAAGLLLAKVGCCSNKTKSVAADAAALKPVSASDKIYETNASNNQYMEFHFTPGKDSYVRSLTRVSDAFDFPIRIAQRFNPHVASIREKRGGKPIRVLDLGCATGASVFELSKQFDDAVGVDLSDAFISSANTMKEGGTLSYEAPDQGRITVQRTAKVDPAAHPERCSFHVGDALNVDPALGTFDGLLAANLLCRVPEPGQLLRSFTGLINSGGILVIISPYSWWEGASAVDKWIGGRPNEPRSEEQVKKVLLESFDFIEEHDEPFLIRDHSRRYQLGFSHCSIWRRK